MMERQDRTKRKEKRRFLRIRAVSSEDVQKIIQKLVIHENRSQLDIKQSRQITQFTQNHSLPQDLYVRWRMKEASWTV